MQFEDGDTLVCDTPDDADGPQNVILLVHGAAGREVFRSFVLNVRRDE